ncbi:MAG: NUDIX hydrolase [Pseudomonadota bacterium]
MDKHHREQHDPNYVSAAELRQTGRAVRPRDAATLIILRRGGGEPRVLMGKRSSNHRFMPNKFVFPGGRVDRADARLRPPHDLHPQVMERLCLGCSPARARALALAAIRETYEETGLILGEPETPTLKTRSSSWGEFLQFDCNPRLDVLHYVARAITPPYRNRRFDARFFLADAEHLQGGVRERPQGSGELLDLHWVTLTEARAMEALPHITRAVLEEVQRRLDAGSQQGDAGPFVHTRHGKRVIDQQ